MKIEKLHNPPNILDDDLSYKEFQILLELMKEKLVGYRSLIYVGNTKSPFVDIVDPELEFILSDITLPKYKFVNNEYSFYEIIENEDGYELLLMLSKYFFANIIIACTSDIKISEIEKLIKNNDLDPVKKYLLFGNSLLLYGVELSIMYYRRG